MMIPGNFIYLSKVLRKGIHTITCSSRKIFDCTVRNAQKKGQCLRQNMKYDHVDIKRIFHFVECLLFDSKTSFTYMEPVSYRFIRYYNAFSMVLFRTYRLW
jgi:hypothetical protein